MKLLALVLIFIACVSAAVAQNVTSAPLQKDPTPGTKQALFVTTFPAAVYACPDGFDLFVERIKPKDSKDPDSSFKGFFWISPPDPKNPNTGMVTSRPGSEVIGACLKVQ